MTTLDLIKEAHAASGGFYLLAHGFLKRQLPRFGAAGSAIALLERRAAECPNATHFVVMPGGRVKFYTPGGPPSKRPLSAMRHLYATGALYAFDAVCR